MVRLLAVNRRAALVACCLVFLLSMVALAVGVRDSKHGLQGSPRIVNRTGLDRFNELPQQPLRVLDNDDCPLRIVEANVREASSSLFTELTGRVTKLEAVSSVPEFKLVNASDKTITNFVLLVRDPRSRATVGVLQNELAIKPGEAITIRREQFIAPEKLTVTDENGRTRQKLVNPSVDSEKYWLHFAPRSDLFATVGRVDFDNGGSWIIKEGGEVR